LPGGRTALAADLDRDGVDDLLIADFTSVRLYPGLPRNP